MKGRRTDLPTAALVKVLKETEGRSENEISSLTGIPAGTVHTPSGRAYGDPRDSRSQYRCSPRDKVAGMLAQSLIDDPNTIDITPTQDGSGNQGGK
jgi:hypothetical protein